MCVLLQRLESRLSRSGDKELQTFMKWLLLAQQQLVREFFIALLDKGFRFVLLGMISD